MAEKNNLNIPIKILIDMLTTLSDEAKEEIFEKVFIEEDRESLSFKERKSITDPEQEFKEGATKNWPVGG